MLLILLKLENNLVVRKVHNLVYLRDMFKASLKELCLVLMKEVLNAVHLDYLSEIMKE